MREREAQVRNKPRMLWFVVDVLAPDPQGATLSCTLRRSNSSKVFIHISRLPADSQCSGHSRVLSAQTQNVLQVVLSHSCVFVVFEVYNYHQEDNHSSTYYCCSYEVFGVVTCRKKKRNREYFRSDRYQTLKQSQWTSFLCVRINYLLMRESTTESNIVVKWLSFQ